MLNFQKFFLLLLAYGFGLAPFDLRAQQIVFTDDNQWPVYSGNSPFDIIGESLPLLKDVKPFAEKHVKTIRFYDAKQMLFCYYELDPFGNISAEGYRCTEYFAIKRKKILEGDSLTISSWYLDTLLMRVDSQLVRHRVYEKADTLMRFTETKTSSYKRGAVLNRRNKFLTYNTTEHMRYKSNYDTTKLFLTVKKHYAENFHASVRVGVINLDTATLRKKEHRFFRAYKRIFLDTSYLQGEGLEFTPEVGIFCGTGIPSDDSVIHTYDKNGLFEARYHIWGNERKLLCTAKYEYYDKP